MSDQRPSDSSSSSSSVSDLPIIIDGKPYANITQNSPALISATSFILGIILGLFLGLLSVLHFKSINIYIIALALFHFLEYFITAKYNPGKVHSDSFLLFSNGREYIGAHSFSIVECLIEYLFFPNMKSFHGFHFYIISIGLMLAVLGQYIRTVAMYTAAQSFSHILKRRKEKDHILVTTGLYSKFRHPSYFGFFWWALGLQMVLLNPISFLLFALVLWRFFSKRIKVEEEYLVSFFGNNYIQYRNTVGVWIPFIN